LIHVAAREIEASFAEKLSMETNTVIGISSNDRVMRSLAAGINRELRTLSVQRMKYQRGDLEVKSAITNISHDIRTPLTSIIGYLELLEKEEVSETASNYIRIIENRADVLQQMTEELFDFSVDASIELNLECESVDVNRILQESVVSLYANFQERGITPHIQMPQKRIIRQADASALARVFSNILNNALKYSDGDLDILLEEDGKISFSNQAVSLNHVEVGRLFDRFYTVENARQSRGLGLSIAKLLVEKMGGTINADYENNRLTIWILLKL
jgi:hypothetical protein